MRKGQYDSKISAAASGNETEANIAAIRIIMHAGFNPHPIIKYTRERGEKNKPDESAKENDISFYPSEAERARVMSTEVQKMLPDGYHGSTSQKEFLLAQKHARQIIQDME